MGSFVSDVIEVGSLGLIDDPLGIEAQEDAAREAARIQAGAGQEAIDVLRADLEPFRAVGTEAANLLLGSVLQPDALQVSAQDVLSDPFFQALAEQQSQDVLAQRAALGLAGSGGTQDILQRNLLQLGEGFRQQQLNEALTQNQLRFNQLMGVSGLGQASAAQTGAQTANLLTGIGSVQSTVPLTQAQAELGATSGVLGLLGAAGGALLGGPAGAAAGSNLGGIVGSGAAVTPPPTNVLSTFSDRRLKKNIVKVDEDEFGNIYEFEYIWGSDKFKGRIAQELQVIIPSAVTLHESGYLRVSDAFRAEGI